MAIDLPQIKTWIESGKKASIIKALENLQAYMLQQQSDHFVAKERVREISRQIPIHSFLPCFDTKSLEQLQLAVTVFGKILDEEDIDSALRNDPMVLQFLDLGYKHPFEIVRRLTINQLAKCSTDTLFSRPELFFTILYSGMIDSEISVQKIAHKIILTVASQPEGLRKLFEDYRSYLIGPLIQYLTHEKKDDIIKFRVHELLASTSAISNEAFEIVEKNDIFKLFAEDLKRSKDDILSLLNLLEIFKHYCVSSYNKLGAVSLKKYGSFDLLMKILTENQNDPLTYSFILNLIADLSDASEDLFDVPLPNSVIEKIFNEDLSNTHVRESQIVAISVIGALCKSSLKNLQQILLSSHERCVQFLCFFVESINDQIAQSFYHSLGSILESSRIDDESAEKLVSILDSILKKRRETSITQPSTSYIMNYAMYNLKAPFPDIRCAVYHLLKGLGSRFNIVKEHINVYPAFFDYITNRSTEPNKETKEWKFSVVETLYNTLHRHPHGSVIDSKHMIDLKTYVIRGAYVGDKVEAQVAVQSEVL
ncbi:hypothetical protein FDP41_004197 [Naegleria fowleri]|uniref:26S proteasome non-ATPase regulatory subunit 5 n=1 Tax=Naegleria fowleri TaxID=5763 RepID=A0A6A5BQ17_NAEFO|nr:uncharacterized protein FDP41_004197 [Naegleria fowleri]KAF0976902.1 hypothetical protein FDP41_004197 [Naegleria fowleri]